MNARTLSFIFLSAVACSSNPASSSGDVALDREFTLKPGESVSVESTDLVVTFQKVVSDSRCPADVMCIQAGEAVVALRVKSRDLQLNTGATPEAPVESYRVRLQGVQPYVFSTKAIAPGDYRATLKVTRP